jgi:hypothetical protein
MFWQPNPSGDLIIKQAEDCGCVSDLQVSYRVGAEKVVLFRD